MPDQVHTPPLPHSETQPKGTVLLAWTPSIEPIASPSTAGFAHPAPPQQPGPSSSTTLPSQSSNGPGLHVLRERVQRLEAALVEHPQPREDDTPDRPPPAYDSRPGSPASGPTQGVGSTRTGGRTS
ncbi:hypothetical protein P691DRAFT_809031 [Macrolepiota fuliginosa MF-IS2]|uniref:Uncharacterized protein n=1 Tax=Macrolepiota fuliginosa MF-IS2 TaxID=1400762 RepID=A0A9P5XKT6_9AGAR|nr:hypothetical protein P691DRAFT_809031 [Macrolepiota fuliginosa MF-IS2]